MVNSRRPAVESIAAPRSFVPVHRRLLAGLAAATLALAACGSDDPSTVDAAPPTEESPAGDASPSDQSSGGSGDAESGAADDDAPATGGDDAPADTGPLTGTFATVDGDMIDLGDFAGQDVILWFWAPW